MQTGNNLSREERLSGSGGMLITLTLTFQFLIGQNAMLGETRVNSFQESHGDQRLTYKVTEEPSCACGGEGYPILVPRPTWLYLPHNHKKRRALGTRMGDILIPELFSFLHELLCRE